MRIFEASIRYTLVRLGEDESLDSPAKVAEYLGGVFEPYPTQEAFFVICLDRKNHPICRSLITLGTLSSSLIHPREIFRIAILASASAIVVAHNHPSGDPTPSEDDIKISRQIKEAGKIMGIELMDHVIIGDTEQNRYYSLAQNGLL